MTCPGDDPDGVVSEWITMDALSMITSAIDRGVPWAEGTGEVLDAPAPGGWVFVRVDSLVVTRGHDAARPVPEGDAATVVMTTAQADYLATVGGRAFMTLWPVEFEPDATSVPAVFDAVDAAWWATILVGFGPDGRAHAHDGCEPRPFEIPGVSDQEAAFVELIESGDVAGVTTSNPQHASPGWHERPPDRRPLDVEITPPEVLADLEEQVFYAVVPPSWREGSNLALCSTSPAGHNGCQAMAPESPDPLRLGYYQSVTEPFPVTFYLIDLSAGVALSDAERLVTLEVPADQLLSTRLVGTGDLSAGAAPVLAIDTGEG